MQKEELVKVVTACYWEGTGGVWSRQKEKGEKKREGECQFRFHSSHYSSDTGQCRGLSLPWDTCGPNNIQWGATLRQPHKNECQCLWATRIILYLSGCIDSCGVDSGPGTVGHPVGRKLTNHIVTRVTPVQQRGVGHDSPRFYVPFVQCHSPLTRPVFIQIERNN